MNFNLNVTLKVSTETLIKFKQILQTNNQYTKYILQLQIGWSVLGQCNFCSLLILAALDVLANPLLYHGNGSNNTVPVYVVFLCELYPWPWVTL